MCSTVPRHTNATALCSSPVDSALGSESDDLGSSPGWGKALRCAGKKKMQALLLGWAKSIYYSLPHYFCDIIPGFKLYSTPPHASPSSSSSSSSSSLLAKRRDCFIKSATSFESIQPKDESSSSNRFGLRFLSSSPSQYESKDSSLNNKKTIFDHQAFDNMCNVACSAGIL